ncbi:MAG: phosphoribosylformylglycinamidine synthase I [Proteobacteria bacterium]|nr:phosphoribosylformylglycinamidine synthase I [Pseudomonadota bacterium]
MTQVNVLVLSGYGLNCDHETAHAFKLAGAHADRIHINAIIDESVTLDKYHILVFGGGFSWGDDHGAGVVQAVRLKTHSGEKILQFINEGKLVIGICNGFQTLVNMGLLPGFDKDYTMRSVALTHNDCGNFRDQWVHLNVNKKSPCVFTRELSHVEFPVRHGEGKFYADPNVIERLEKNNQVVLRYALENGEPANGLFPDNPNGSIKDIAGICDTTGRVFGLMPHPEAYHHFTNHPDWTLTKEMLRRQEKSMTPGMTSGIKLFRNAVLYMENA